MVDQKKKLKGVWQKGLLRDCRDDEYAASIYSYIRNGLTLLNLKLSMCVKTVNDAFHYFIKEVVNLDVAVVDQARASMDNLVENIVDFDGDDDFFALYPEVNIQFGSFARGTKIRPLDDIDLMIGLSAKGCTYDASLGWDKIRMYAKTKDESLLTCSEGGSLNSTKIINRLIKKLESIPDYCRSDLHKNKQAAVLNLLSKEWSFDIVPCFYTKPEADGRQYYLIPNGNGDWMKTDPARDRDVLLGENERLEGRLKLLIRLMKKWDRVKKVKTLPSYALETLIINRYTEKDTISTYPDIELRCFLDEFANDVCQPIKDIKEIQGDLNELSYSEKQDNARRAKNDSDKAQRAWEYEKDGDHETAINLWREILGADFPQYG